MTVFSTGNNYNWVKNEESLWELKTIKGIHHGTDQLGGEARQKKGGR